MTESAAKFILVLYGNYTARVASKTGWRDQRDSVGFLEQNFVVCLAVSWQNDTKSQSDTVLLSRLRHHTAELLIGVWQLCPRRSRCFDLPLWHDDLVTWHHFNWTTTWTDINPSKKNIIQTRTPRQSEQSMTAASGSSVMCSICFCFFRQGQRDVDEAYKFSSGLIRLFVNLWLKVRLTVKTILTTKNFHIFGTIIGNLIVEILTRDDSNYFFKQSNLVHFFTKMSTPLFSDQSCPLKAEFH